jgi:hypothetical protein
MTAEPEHIVNWLWTIKRLYRQALIPVTKLSDEYRDIRNRALNPSQSRNSHPNRYKDDQIPCEVFLNLAEIFHGDQPYKEERRAEAKQPAGSPFLL